MAYKVGFILSLLLVIQLFVLAGDIFSAQITYTNLDAVSITAGNIISSKGEISDELKSYVKNLTGGEISAVGDENPMFGSIFTFKIAKEFKPMNKISGTKEISVIRSVVIGYIN